MSVFSDESKLTLGWYWLFPARDLKPGQRRGYEFWGKKLVVFRGESGRLGVLDAFCKHMNNDMSNFSCINKDKLTCKYHGWKYDSQGVCTGKTQGQDGIRIDSYPVVERFGLIWFWPSTSVPPSSPEPFAGLEFTFDRAWPVFYDLPCHPIWTTVNAADGTHFDHIHGLRRTEMVHSEVTESGLMHQKWRIILKSKEGAYYRPFLMKMMQKAFELVWWFYPSLKGNLTKDSLLWVDNHIYIGDGGLIFERMSFFGTVLWEAVIAPTPVEGGCKFVFCFLSDKYFLRYWLGRMIIAQGISEDMPIYIGNKKNMPELTQLMPSEKSVLQLQSTFESRPHIVAGQW